MERFFERLFERPTARLFGARLQPVQIQRRLERAMENERLTSAGRTVVPNRYAVHLHPADLDSFGELVEALAGELADSCLAYARQHHYTLSDRPQVALVSDDKVAAGEIHVAAKFGRPEPDEQRSRTRDPQAERAEHPEGAGHAGAAVGDGVDAEASDEEAAAAQAASGSGGERFVTADGQGPFRRQTFEGGDQTRVFEVPQVRSPRAVLRLVLPDGSDRQVSVNGAAVSVGRATDNDLVVHDARVSRHHARLQPRNGVLVLTDLDSTNGTRVNGMSIHEIALGEGDRIELGDSVLIVESSAGR